MGRARAGTAAPATGPQDLALLEALQRDAVGYFLRAVNPENGLIADSSRAGSPCSIAATGLGLSVWVVAAERGLLSRTGAAQRTLAALRFFRASPQGTAPDATGHRGFYYHFLDMGSGRRVWDCELSMIDTAILIAGVLVSAAYFTGVSEEERQIRELAQYLSERVEWDWAVPEGSLVRMGWRPGSGFLSYGWEGYSEAILLYVLGLGSPTHPLPGACFSAATKSYQWENLYDTDHLFAAPLFIHQLPQVWLDLRGIQDPYMRSKGIDYFENSRRATSVQQEYAIRNPLGFDGYGVEAWGVTAGLGPGFCTQQKDGGLERQYYGYVARGVPFGPDDGTLAPWAVAASLPFAPELVVRTLRGLAATWPRVRSADGLLTSLNPTFDPGDGSPDGWLAPEHQGLDQGPVALMIENHRSGLLWRLMRGCPAVVRGLRRAGFRGGWLRAQHP